MRVWDSGRSAQQQESPAAHQHAAVACIAVASDGLHAVSGGEDRTVVTWNTRGQSLERVCTFPASDIPAGMSLAVNGRVLAVTPGPRAAAVLVDPLRDSVLCKLGRDVDDVVKCVAVSGDGRVVAVGTYSAVVLVYSAAHGKLKHRLTGHTRLVACVAISGNGGYIVSGSFDHTLRVWNGITGEQLHVLDGHSNLVTSVGLSSDGRRAVSASDDQTVRVWDVMTGTCVRTLSTGATMAGVGLSADGLLVLLVTGQRTSILDVSTCQCIAAFHFDTAITAAAMNDSGGVVVCGDVSGGVHMLRLVAKVCNQFAALSCCVSCVVFDSLWWLLRI